MSILSKVASLLGSSTAAKMNKAGLQVYGERGVTNIPCLFNPTSYSISRSVSYQPVRALGSDLELVQFASCSSSILHVTLFFDSLMISEKKPSGLFLTITTDEAEENARPVTDYTAPIVAATRIDGKLHRPPRVGFVWGNLNFCGVVTSVDEEFLMFSKDGKPVRECMTLTIESARTDASSARTSPFESPDRTKCVRFTEGMSLWQLAYDEYGDPNEWKRIARENKISDPLSIEVGTLLRVPAL